uniref:Uncharacterized protein n=1 Tax=viral metagenome TaxID=1070528 RepID=A0A6M3LF87_9ZZZZ
MAEEWNLDPDDLQEGVGSDPFVGTITKVVRTTGKEEYGGKRQLDIWIVPEGFQISGATGALHQFLTETTYKATAFGYWFLALKAAGYSFKGKSPEEMIGMRLAFQRKDMPVKKKTDAGAWEDSTLDMILPIGPAPEATTAVSRKAAAPAAKKAAETPAASALGASSAPAAASSGSDIDSETATKIIDLVGDGIKKAALIQALSQAGLGRMVGRAIDNKFTEIGISLTADGLYVIG